MGHLDEAAEHYATAVTVNAKIGARPYVALARIDWADALRSRGAPGDRAQALVLAGQAAAEAQRLDMPGPCRRASELARQLRQAGAAENPLTRREHEIAELVSAGLTNRAIADQLVLSERTVEVTSGTCWPSCSSPTAPNSPPGHSGAPRHPEPAPWSPAP